MRRRLVRAAEDRAPELRTARIRARGPIVDGEVVEQPRTTRADGMPKIIEGTVVEVPQNRAS